MKKLLSLLLATAMMSMTLVGCGGESNEKAKADADAINIGVLAPTTGNVAVYGQTSLNGFLLAAEHRNTEGGVLGKQINLMHEDEEGDPTKAVNAYNKLVGNDVVAILGDITSKPTIAVAQVVAQSQEQLPMMTPTATASDVTTFGDTVFKACFNDPYQGEAMANYAMDKLGAKTAAVLFDNADDYSLGTAEAFKETAEKIGLELVSYESFTGQDTVDFKSQLTTIKGKNPDVVFVPTYYNVIALILTQAKNDVGVDAQFIGCDGWDGVVGALSEGQKNIADGAIFSNHYYTDDPDEVVSTFVSEYEAKFGELPTAFSALSYDGAMMMFDAIENAGSTDAAAIVGELKDTSYTGVTGHIFYENGGDPTKSLTMITIKDGKYKLLEEYSVGEESNQDDEAKPAEGLEKAQEAE